MRNGLRILAGLVGLNAIAAAWQVVKTDEQPADALIVMQRGACEKRCAVYKVVIFADGSAIFDGRYNVKRPGLFKTTISRDAVGKLLAEAEALNFFALSGKSCATIDPASPNLTLTVGGQGKSRTIVQHLGCPGQDTDKLKQFGLKIDTALQTAKWVR